MRYFHKFNVRNNIYVNGKPVPFEVLAENEGVLAIDDSSSDSEAQAVLRALSAAAQAKILGVSEITKEQYEDLKKNLPLLRFEPSTGLYPKLSAPSPEDTPPQPPAGLGPSESKAEDASPAEQPVTGPLPDQGGVAAAEGFTPATRKIRPNRVRAGEPHE